MSLSALSLTAALPAAAGLAQSAVEVGGELGSGFLNVLAGLTHRGDKEASAASEAAPAAKPALPSKTQSWSEKLMSWLANYRVSGNSSSGNFSSGNSSSGELEVELSLDALDQPHVSVHGENAEAIEAAMAADPTWLQEFRELALDRSADLGGPASGPLNAPPLSLKITQRAGEVDAAWQ